MSAMSSLRSSRRTWASTVRSLRTSPFGDTSVGHPLRHQPEYLVLALGELSKAVLAGIAVEERGNDLRVERGASVGDSTDGAEEIRDVQHTVLQQIAEPT
jgi:hypothetical protein